MKERLKLAERIAKRAGRIRPGEEDTWNTFLKTTVFEKWAEAAQEEQSVTLTTLDGTVAMLVLHHSPNSGDFNCV